MSERDARGPEEHEHVLLRWRRAYGFNPKGQPHSAMIAQETMALVTYAGEPDRIDSLEVADVG